MSHRLLALFAFCVIAVLPLRSLGATSKVKPIPLPGIAIDETDRSVLREGADQLEAKIALLEKDPRNEAHIPDLEIFHKAVDWALRYDEFFDKKQIAFAKALLKEGESRAEALGDGKMPWLEASGNVLRGYRSAVDGSVQPYGLTIPEGIAAHAAGQHSALVWLLGRDDKRTELAFMQDAKTKPTPLAPPGVIVIRPYGRFCNATKFAGETDVMEVLVKVEGEYQIDPNHIGLAGFSMGGASVWHLAAHYSNVWCVASPGAGFAETPIYAKALDAGKPARYPWEIAMWHWYDALACSANLSNLHAIAYSGEIDPQRQSADLMEKAMADEGLTLERLIGPNTAHKYEPETKKVLETRVDAAIAKGRDTTSGKDWLVTYTLCAPQAGHLIVWGMKHEWERAEILSQIDASNAAVITTHNVTEFTLFRPHVRAVIDGQVLAALSMDDRYHQVDGKWLVGGTTSELAKRPGLCGPVDDAFRSAFVFVRPTGTAANALVATWANAEMTKAAELWRRTFRGDVPFRDDTGVTDDDIASKNLVLWGDPSSNTVLARIVGRLPVRWDAKEIAIAGKTYSAADHSPILIFPNPLNPRRYIVINSGIDFRDEAYGTNALQTPKLPDWSVVDLTIPPDGRWPGKIADAGFFDESWRSPTTAFANY